MNIAKTANEHLTCSSTQNMFFGLNAHQEHEQRVKRVRAASGAPPARALAMFEVKAYLGSCIMFWVF